MDKIQKLIASSLAFMASTLAFPAHAVPMLFVSTGKTGAQVQTDINHTQHWTFSVSQNVTVNGGLFTMKDGPSSVENVSFVIFEGEYSSFPNSYNALFNKTLSNGDFTQQFKPIFFQNTAISLLAGHSYTGVLFSNAADTQSTAYFVKGGSNSPLVFVDQNGSPVTSIETTSIRATITPNSTIPEPTILVLMSAPLAVMAWKLRRRASI